MSPIQARPLLDFALLGQYPNSLGSYIKRVSINNVYLEVIQGSGIFTPSLDNQMEKHMEHDMGTGI